MITSNYIFSQVVKDIESAKEFVDMNAIKRYYVIVVWSEEVDNDDG